VYNSHTMTLDDIRKHILKDMCLDDAALDLESLKIPQLHGKYLNFLTDERLSLKKAESEYHSMLRIKWEYYTGKMSQEQLDARGWEPFALKILRNDIDLYINSDEHLIKINQRIAYSKEKISLLEEVVKELNTRHWKIRNAIEWRKFTSGQ
jgi:Recombination, repair and ssDNA binding protein UvsY